MTLFDQEPESLKQSPEYWRVLKGLLKYQINALCTRLADTGEESFVVTASVNEGHFSHIGSPNGIGFLEQADDIKWKFLKFCKKSGVASTRCRNKTERKTDRQKQSSTAAFYVHDLDGNSGQNLAGGVPNQHGEAHSRKWKEAAQSRKQPLKHDDKETDMIQLDSDSEELAGFPVKESHVEEEIRSSSAAFDSGEYYGGLDAVRSPHIDLDENEKGQNVATTEQETDVRLIKVDPDKIKVEHADIERLITSEEKQHDSGQDFFCSFKNNKKGISNRMEQPEVAESESYKDSDYLGVNVEDNVPHADEYGGSEDSLIICSDRQFDQHTERNLESTLVSTETAAVHFPGHFNSSQYLYPAWKSRHSGLHHFDNSKLRYFHDTDTTDNEQITLYSKRWYSDDSISNENPGDDLNTLESHALTEKTTYHAESHPSYSRRKVESKKQCPVCYKVFTRKDSMNVHMRIHRGEKPYKCNICGKCFTHVGNLAPHMRTHTGEKPYQCPCCPKSFCQGSNLRSHIRIHYMVQTT